MIREVDIYISITMNLDTQVLLRYSVSYKLRWEVIKNKENTMRKAFDSLVNFMILIYVFTKCFNLYYTFSHLKQYLLQDDFLFP